MKDKVVVVLFGIAVILFGYSVFQNTNTGQSNHPLFLGERGKVVDPYINREVKNTMRANARDIQVCYNKFIARAEKNKDAITDGALHIDWLVSARGKASKGRVVSNQLADDKLKACVLSRVMSWSFPPSGEPRYCEHKFNFKKK